MLHSRDQPIEKIKHHKHKKHHKKKESDGFANWERALLNRKEEFNLFPKQKQSRTPKRSTKNQSWDGKPQDLEQFKKLAGGLMKMIKGKTDLEKLAEYEQIKAKQEIKPIIDKAKAYVKEYKHQKKLERREKLKSAIKFIPDKLKRDHTVTFASNL